MANPEHLEILKQGVDQWNRWRSEHPDVRPDLPGANLRGANLEHAKLGTSDLRKADLRDANLNRGNLSGADLSEANLSRAYLFGADLIGVNFCGADLSETDLNRANLSEADIRAANLAWADLRKANLMRADLREARLIWTNLKWSDLTGADLTRARIAFASFAEVNLSLAKGLETVVHEGPSTVGIDTIYKSRGKIPEVFLRGCGVPDEFIAYIGSMVGRPIEFYSCFISYSTKDQEFAERLHADLQVKGVRCWFAPEEMKAGRKLHEQIDEAIRLHDKLLLILSEHSMSSEWVKTEIANAREHEKREAKQLLFPITLVPFEAIKQWKLFDADIGMDSAREIREYFIPDFSNWKDHDSYQTAFQRLVSDLKAGAGK
jgi:uncharacterized protein YjbI with pentapeptide repeats